MELGETFALVVFLAGIAGYVFVLLRLRKTKRIFITDYQRGVRYKAGVFAGEVGPGSYDVYTPTEQVLVIDMRPQPFVIERLLYRDPLQAPSVISIGGQLKVSDPHSASTALKDQINESIAIVRDTLRETVSKSISGTEPETRERMARTIETAANGALARVGMTVGLLEITETWSQSVQALTKGGDN
jgi:hypothetical protein